MKTLVLLSGGLDSTVVLAACKAAGDECSAVGFEYGQRHHIELDRAKEIARHYNVPFERICLPLFLGATVDNVVFPGRNLAFASVAIALAQSRGIKRIAVGCNATDWLRFPDCRPTFWRRLNECAGSYGVEVVTPLIYFSKSDVVTAARKYGVPIKLTWSCYSPKILFFPVDGPTGTADDCNAPCGECLACTTREEALCSI